MRSQREYELGVGLMNENSLPMAFQHLLEAVRLDEENAEAHNVLGVLFTARRNFRVAEEHLQAALALTQNHDLELRPSLGAEIHNNLGVLYLEQDRFDDAIAQFEGATADLLYTTPYLAWANLGYAYFKKEQYPDAVRALQQSVTLQRDFCLGYLRLGQTYLAMHQFDDAEQALTHVVEVPNETCNRTQDAWKMRGEARAQLGHRDDATTDFERCVELSAESDVGLACRRYLETLH
ncbi:MAG: tetratricopeptide repeat protein [Sandaracinaceae bacterium]|jgi:type IV pilus assembly protein PilF|nr:tetratricopeptide repeat protein [Sandaracinaceae bacterium]